MTWVKLDDGMPEKDIFERTKVGPYGGWMHVTALAYCNRTLNDGTFPRSRARRLIDVDEPDSIIDTLIRFGLWRDAGNDYLEIVDFLADQPSADAVLRKREQWKERTARARARSESRRDIPRDDSRDSARPVPVPARDKGTARTSAKAPLRPSLEDRPKRVRAPRKPKLKPVPKPEPIPPDERPTMLVIEEAQSEADLSRAFLDARALGREWTNVQTKAVRDRKITLGIIKDTAHATALPVVDGIAWVDRLHLP